MAAVAIAGVGMMMVCSSSLAVALLASGEEEKPDTTTTSGGSGADDTDDDDDTDDTDDTDDDNGSGGSAAAATQPTEIAPVWKLKGNKKISGGTFIKSVDEGSVGPCKDECFEDKDCKGFTYKHFGKKCTLYSGNIDFKTDYSLSRSSFKINRQYE